MVTNDPAIVGFWTEPVNDDAHLAIHSIHRPTGKFLQYGKDDSEAGENQYDEDKAVWFPPEHCSPFEVGVENCDLKFQIGPIVPYTSDHIKTDLPEVDLFCSGHVNAPPYDDAEELSPQTITIGGQPSFGENSGINGSYTFEESMSDTFEPLNPGNNDVESTWTEINNGEGEDRWYPTLTTLPDGRFLATGGTTYQTVLCRREGEQEFQTGIDCSCEVQSQEQCEPGCYRANALEDLDVDPPVIAPCVCAYYASPAQKSALGFAVCNQELTPTSTIDILEREQGIYDWNRLLEDVPEAFSELYPFVFVLPDLPIFDSAEVFLGGKLFIAGSETASQDVVRTSLFDTTEDSEGFIDFGGLSCTPGSSSVMYQPGKVMKFGGGETPSRLTEVIDFTTNETNEEGEYTTTWKTAGSTSTARHFSTAILLPDGTVLATGGASAGNVGDSNAERVVSTTERFDPDSETWCRLADQSQPGNASDTYRGYHSQSFLLPDGRVYLGAGGNRGPSELDHFDHQFFFPPYLFKGPRPEIIGDVESPPRMFTGQDFTIQINPEVPVDRITMIKLSSSTHQWDMEQRFIELSIIENLGSSLLIEAPDSTCYATPGPYMIFALSPAPDEVPSIGRYVYLDGTCDAAESPIVVSNTDNPGGALVNGTSSNDLTMACRGAPSSASISTFGRTIGEICSAFDACPSDAAITMTARLISSDTISVPDEGLALDSGQVVFTSGHPRIHDNLELHISGLTWDQEGVNLGPGRSVLELCLDIEGMIHCREQSISITSPLSGSDESHYRAGEIEARPLTLREIQGASRLNLNNNEVLEVPLPLGFTFQYYDETYRSIFVGANGGLRVTPGEVPPANAPSLPTFDSGAHIAPFWSSLDVEAPDSGVYTYYTGNKFIVAWSRVAHPTDPEGQTVSFQAHLFSDGRVEFHYSDTTFGEPARDHGSSATIGIQDPSHLAGLELSCNNHELLETTRALAFTTEGCIASAMRLADQSPCSVRLAASRGSYIKGCEGGNTVLAAPTAPTMCRIPNDAHVLGTMHTPSGEVRFAPGFSDLPLGDVTLTWDLYRRLAIPDGPVYRKLGEGLSGMPLIQESRDLGLCCADEQEQHLLSNASDSSTLNSAVCVAGMSGDDMISTGNHDDTVIGGNGDDIIDGGNGDDRLFGSSGNDVLMGENGDDLMNGDMGHDTLIGGNGRDTLIGGPGDDGIDGGKGSDVIFPGSGNDSVSGGNGDDVIVILHSCEVSSGKVIDGGKGSDILLLPAGVSLQDLLTEGVEVLDIEQVDVVSPQYQRVSDCDPILGDLAVPE